MKSIVFSGFLLLLAIKSFAQMEIFKLSKQPRSFYKTLDTRDAVINDTTTELIGNVHSIQEMTITFSLFKHETKVFSDTSFSMVASDEFYERIKNYADSASLPIGVPVLFQIDKTPLLIFFVWNPVSSFGCDCIAAFTDKENKIIFRLGPGSEFPEKTSSYYNNTLLLYNYLKTH